MDTSDSRNLLWANNMDVLAALRPQSERMQLPRQVGPDRLFDDPHPPYRGTHLGDLDQLVLKTGSVALQEP